MSKAPEREELIKKIELLETELKAAKELTQKFQTIVDEATDCIFCKDLERKYTYVNPAMIKLLGCCEADVIGKTPEEILDGKEAAVVREVDERNLSGESVSAIRDLKIGDAKHTFHTVQSPMRNSDGKIVGITGIVRNITEQKRAEAALAEQQSKLSSIASQVPGMIYQFMMSPDGKYTVPYCSEGVRDLFGCSPEDVSIDFGPILKVIFPEDQERLLKSIEDSRKRMSQWICEYRVQVGEGPVKWLYGNSVPEKRPDGSIVWSGHTVEITRLKEAEAALRESEIRFRQFFEHLTIGVAVCEAVNDGEDFIICDLNAAGQKLARSKAKEVWGRKVTEVFPSAKEMALLESLKDAWRSGRSNHVPFRQYKDNRIELWVENRVFKMPSGRVVVLFEDRTEIMRLEEGVRQAQKMEAIGTLAGGIAHDFNNVLGILTGNISYALSILKKDDPLFEVLSDMMQGTKQGQGLTQQLLTFARGGEPIKNKADINQLLLESATFVTSGSKSKCSFDLAEDPMMAEVDTGQIHQLISNLIINADQAMPGGGIIAIKTQNVSIDRENNMQLDPGSYIQISIEDHGIGIPEEHIPRIFEPYYTTKSKGSGLGLATSYSIARRHGGSMCAYSELGRGAVFHVYLPASAGTADEDNAATVIEHNGQGRVLIMDDMEAISKTAARILNHMGYDCATAREGAEAVDMYRQAQAADRPFKVVMLDLTVPGGMGGVEALSELLKIDPEVRALVSSGYSNDPVMAHYDDYGFYGVVPKPYTRDNLAEVFNQLPLG